MVSNTNCPDGFAKPLVNENGKSRDEESCPARWALRRGVVLPTCPQAADSSQPPQELSSNTVPFSEIRKQRCVIVQQFSLGLTAEKERSGYRSFSLTPLPHLI